MEAISTKGLLLRAVALSILARLGSLQPLCSVEWSISNSYTVASEQSSYVTLNLYASNNGTDDLKAPYNLTIYNPAYVDAFSWNFELSLKVAGTADGVVYGETILANAFWETLLANSKNVVNIGGNIETTQLGAEPEGITIGGLECKLKQRVEEVPDDSGSDTSTSNGATSTTTGSGTSAGSTTSGSTAGSGSSFSSTSGNPGTAGGSTGDLGEPFTGSTGQSGAAGGSTGSLGGPYTGSNSQLGAAGGSTGTLGGPYVVTGGGLPGSRSSSASIGSPGGVLPVLPLTPIPAPFPVPAPVPAFSPFGFSPFDGVPVPAPSDTLSQA